MGTSRRDHGAGSVYKRAQDGLWIGTIEAGYTKTGARRRLTVTGKTKAEAVRKRREKAAQLERDGLPAAGTRVTVKKWSETWLTMKADTLRPSSLRAATFSVNRWIVPTIGHRRLDELTPADVRQLHQAFSKAGRAASYAVSTHRVLMGMLKDAIVEGHNVPPRVLLVKAPVKNISDRDRMTVEEVIRVLAVASSKPQGLRWSLALLHGVRQGEALGMTWDSIDFEKRELILNWQLQAVVYAVKGDPESGFLLPANLPRQHLVGRWHLLPPKSRKGFRVLPLRDAEVDALEKWQAVQVPNPWGLVWTDPRNKPRHHTLDRAEFQAIQDEAGVRHPAGRYYLVHEARHTAASMMQEMGADEHTIMSQLGHASIVTSRAYMHTDTTAARELAERVSKGYGLD